jgi:hypothetical protein
MYLQHYKPILQQNNNCETGYCIWVILQKVAIFIFQIQKNKTVIGTSLLNSKHSNNIKESEKNMYFKKFNQYMLTYVIIYDLVVSFVIPVTLLFFFVQKNLKR